IICILGFAIIRTFHALNLAYIIHRFVNASGFIPGPVISVAILLASAMPVGTYLFVRRNKSSDAVLGLGLMVFSVCMGLSPLALTLVAKLRGRSFDDALYCLWQVIAVSLSLFGLGWILAGKNKLHSLFAQDVKVGWMLMSGFFAGVLLSLALISG